MRHIPVILVLPVLLAAGSCGGGSGNTTISTRIGNTVPTQLSSFSSLGPGEAFRADGIGRVAEYETNAAGAATVGPSELVDVTMLGLLDAFGFLGALEIETEQVFGSTPTGAAFDVINGDTVVDGFGVYGLVAGDQIVLATAAEDQAAIVADPFEKNLEFQTFGAWANGIGPDGMNSEGVVGAASVGVPTLAANLPTSDANYDGTSTGFFVSPAGVVWLAFADFDAMFDFDTGMLDVATSGTTLVDPLTGAQAAMGTLDFSGQGSATQPFAIAIATDSLANDLAGTLNGQFYGPNGEELGGPFDMTGTDGRYMGAVGAAQP